MAENIQNIKVLIKEHGIILLVCWEEPKSNRSVNCCLVKERRFATFTLRHLPEVWMLPVGMKAYEEHHVLCYSRGKV